jgi:hypothetical protein
MTALNRPILRTGMQLNFEAVGAAAQVNGGAAARLSSHRRDRLGSAGTRTSRLYSGSYMGLLYVSAWT